MATKKKKKSTVGRTPPLKASLQPAFKKAEKAAIKPAKREAKRIGGRLTAGTAKSIQTAWTSNRPEISASKAFRKATGKPTLRAGTRVPATDVTVGDIAADSARRKVSKATGVPKTKNGTGFSASKKKAKQIRAKRAVNKALKSLKKTPAKKKAATKKKK